MIKPTVPTTVHANGLLYLHSPPASITPFVQTFPVVTKPFGVSPPLVKLQSSTCEAGNSKSSRLIEHLGYHWHFEKGLVSLSDTEREKTLLSIEKALASTTDHTADLVQLQQVFSRLLHASHIVVRGRLHIRSLAKGLLDAGQKKSSSESVKLQSWIRCDLSWWRKLLRMNGDVAQVQTLKKAMIESTIYTDATPNHGCAMVVNGQWKNWRWRNKFVPDNNWAEAIAVEMAIRYLVKQPRKAGKSHFEILCDSQAVGLSWTKGGSNNPLLNRVLLSMVDILVQHNCWLSLKWIPSGENLADKPSRFKADGRIGQELESDNSFIPQEMQAYF